MTTMSQSSPQTSGMLAQMVMSYWTFKVELLSHYVQFMSALMLNFTFACSGCAQIRPFVALCIAADPLNQPKHGELYIASPVAIAGRTPNWF